MTEFSASDALRPLAIRSSTSLPIVGSVIFWVDTAPAPARTQGQRLPTQMLDVVIAIPVIPLSSQTPVIEKVMACLSSISIIYNQLALLSGITAVTSISTNHSGRASAETTSPVEHGCTPLNHLPIS